MSRPAISAFFAVIYARHKENGAFKNKDQPPRPGGAEKQRPGLFDSKEHRATLTLATDLILPKIQTDDMSPSSPMSFAHFVSLTTDSSMSQPQEF